SGILAAAALRPAGEPLRPGAPGYGPGRVLSVAAGLLAAVLVLWSFDWLADADAARRAKQARAGKMRRGPKPGTDRLYVVWREWFPFEHLVSPLRDPTSLRSFPCVSLSVVLPTPLTERRLSEFGIRDVYRAICKNPRVSLIAIPQLVENVFQ